MIDRRRLRRRILGASLCLGLGSLMSLPAYAAQFPDHPVRIILPQPPGGAADRLARVMGEHLEKLWKQPVLVENRPGGGVIVGTSATARAPPDGHTIGLLGSSLSINAVQRKDLPYDTLKDLQPIARIGYYTVALVAARDFPADSVPALIDLAKKQPGKISFGSNGIGTSAQLAGEMLNHMAGIELLHIPYNGAAKMYTDIIGSQIPIGFGVASSAEAFVKQGKLKVLAVTSKERSPLYPDWPTIAETLPGFEAINWAGFVAPAGVAPDVAQRLGDDILKVLATPEMAKLIADMGIEVSPQGPKEFGQFIRSELSRFAEVTKPLSAPGK